MPLETKETSTGTTIIMVRYVLLFVRCSDCVTDLQKFQEFKVRVRTFYRTSRSSGYCGTGVDNSQKFRAGTKHAVPVPRVLWPQAYITFTSSMCGYECRTELTQVTGTGINVLQEITEVLCTGKYPGYGLYVPYRTQLWKILNAYHKKLR